MGKGRERGEKARVPRINIRLPNEDTVTRSKLPEPAIKAGRTERRSRGEKKKGGVKTTCIGCLNGNPTSVKKERKGVEGRQRMDEKIKPDAKRSCAEKKKKVERSRIRS